MSTISVVIPSLNDGVLLRNCLHALSRQTRPPDEIIVVDNGSVDDTQAIARAAGARVLSQPVPGIWPTAAMGFDAAGSDVIARLDADSLPAANWLERIDAWFSGSASPTAVTGAGIFYGGNSVLRFVGRAVYLPLYFEVMGALFGHPPLFGSNFAIRRSAWLRVRDDVHTNRADIHDDLDLTWQLHPDMTVAWDPELKVGISARPLETFPALGKRLAKAIPTIALNWRECPPSVRRRLRAGQRHAVSARPYSSMRSRQS